MTLEYTMGSYFSLIFLIMDSWHEVMSFVKKTILISSIKIKQDKIFQCKQYQ